MKSRHFLPVLAVLGLSGTAPAIQIEIRYDYDTNGFFNQPGSKEALRQVADYFEGLLHDSLLAIDHTQWPAGNTWTAVFEHPGTGAETHLANLKVPADTIVIFAGGRSLGDPAGRGGFGGYFYSWNQPGWATAVGTRGEAGVLANPPTDFAPWGGFVTFDTAETWNFSLTTPVADTTPFVSIALHELGHALGLGTALSWDAKIVSGNFTGTRAVQAYGGNIPLDPDTNYGHWRNNQCGGTDGYLASDPNKILSKAYGSFGAPHGFAQIALMDPSVCTNGVLQKVMTDLDLAALRDVGWELEPPVDLTVPNLSPAASPFVFSWPSTSGFTYRLQRSPSLAAGSWTTLSTQTGNGTLQQFSTAAPALPAAFYRLVQDAPAAGAPLPLAPGTTIPTQSPPVAADGCGCSAPW
jgi:hypothetical protein